MTGYFLATADLPESFLYPHLYHRVVELGLVNWGRWELMHDKSLDDRVIGLADRYPARQLVPFAWRGDRDDLACFDADEPAGTISIIDDFSAAGFEQMQKLTSFEDWLRIAFDVMLTFDD